MKRLPHRDVVIVGLGWTGSILAHGLAEHGLDVIAIERGPWRDTATDYPPSYAPDELRYHIRHELFLQPAQMTFTFRNNINQEALPIREWGAFMLGTGVGGGGVHWNAETWRFAPTDFVLKTHLTQRYGASFIPSGMTIQDWGVTYDELEPYYTRFEYLCGTSGTAGNLKGTIMPGGNPYEGERSKPYPTPAMKQPFSATLFGKAAANLGYHPFPQPSGNLSQAYTNPLGVQQGPCTFCGYCEWFGCGNYSKASPQTTILPALMRQQNFTARDNCEVTKVLLDSSGKRATGVTFVDTSGEEYEQPADLVLLCAFSVFNVQLLMVSGIGQIYDPSTKEGVLGRNFTHQTVSKATGYFDPKKFVFTPFVAAGAIGICIDDFNGDNFDHGPLGFVGGGYMGQVQTNGRPITTTPVPLGTPTWGAKWKAAVKTHYNSSVFSDSGVHGCFYAYDDVYLDLDPTWKDRFGRPLMRMTIDFHDNEHRMSAFLTEKYVAIIKAMGAQLVEAAPRKGHYNIAEYQTSHLCGGAIMGADPKTSVVNRYQQHWQVPNLFSIGASSFPQNAGYNPTGTVGAMAFWTLDAIRDRYLKSPGPLVQV